MGGSPEDAGAHGIPERPLTQIPSVFVQVVGQRIVIRDHVRRDYLHFGFPGVHPPAHLLPRGIAVPMLRPVPVGARLNPCRDMRQADFASVPVDHMNGFIIAQTMNGLHIM